MNTLRHSRTANPVISVFLVAMATACASGSPPTSGPVASVAPPTAASSAAAPSRPSSAPSASLEPAPTIAAPTPAVIDPGDRDPDAPLALAWQGEDPTGTADAFGPGIAPDGRIWAGIDGQNQFMIFEPDGTYVETWGTPGADEGEINFMHNGTDAFGGIVFASDGSFFISESGNRRVSKFDADRNFVMAWGSFGAGADEFLVPDDIAIDGADNVYIRDDEQGVLKMFTADGEYVRSFAPDTGPYASVSSDGHVYASNDGGDLLEFAPDGTLVRTIDMTGLAANPRTSDVNVSSDGHIWISSVVEAGPRDNPDKLIELDENGKLLHRWEGMTVVQFAIDPDGERLYAALGDQLFIAAYELPTE